MNLLFRRILAYLIDLFISLMLVVLLSILIGEEQADGTYNVTFPLALAPMLLFVSYFILLEVYVGRTFGKMIMKLVVTKDDEKSRLTLLQSFGRHLLDPVDILCGVGVILIAMTDRKKRLGDILFKTKVLKV